MRSIINKIKCYFQKTHVFTLGNQSLFILNKKSAKGLKYKYSSKYTFTFCSGRTGKLYEDGDVYMYSQNYKTIDYFLDTSLIPHFDGEYPTELNFRQDKTLASLYYINMDGLGGCFRTNMELPVIIQFHENGSVEYEHYQNYGRKNEIFKPTHISAKGAPWVQPLEIFYDENGGIIEDKTYWVYYINNQSVQIPYTDHAHFVSTLGLNIDNFKDFTKADRDYIEVFLVPENYRDLLEKLDIPIEDILDITEEQKELIRMYLY